MYNGKQGIEDRRRRLPAVRFLVGWRFWPRTEEAPPRVRAAGSRRLRGGVSAGSAWASAAAAAAVPAVPSAVAATGARTAAEAATASAEVVMMARRAAAA